MIISFLYSLTGEHRETLLHFSSRFGFLKFSKHLLTLNGGVEALEVANQSGLLPSDIADTECYNELATYLIR